MDAHTASCLGTRAGSVVSLALASSRRAVTIRTLRKNLSALWDARPQLPTFASVEMREQIRTVQMGMA